MVFSHLKIVFILLNFKMSTLVINYNQDQDLYSLVSYVPIHVIMLVIFRVEMHQDATLTPVSDCVVYYYPE